MGQQIRWKDTTKTPTNGLMLPPTHIIFTITVWWLMKKQGGFGSWGEEFKLELIKMRLMTGAKFVIIRFLFCLFASTALVILKFHKQESTNTWHGTWHLRWHRRHHSCGIVKLPYNDEKRLYVFGGYHGGWR